MTDSERTAERAYVLVVFLLLIALLSTTVATFSLTSIYNLREADAIRDREVGYQMARSGLSLWMGNIKKDWEENHDGSSSESDGDDGDVGTGVEDDRKICEGFDPMTCSASFSMSRAQARCCDYEDAPTRDDGGSGGDSEQEELDVVSYGPDHYWGWGADIIEGEYGIGIDMGDTVWIPSETSGPSPRDGDVGYFRILHVETADGEFPDDGANLEDHEKYEAPEPTTSCRDVANPGNDKRIDVNTASYDHLRQVKYNPRNGDTKALSHEMVMDLIEERSGGNYDVREGEEFTLRDEEYTWAADPFEHPSEVCEVLQEVDDTFDGDHGCEGNYDNGIFDYIKLRALYTTRYCARIEGGVLSESGPPRKGYEIRAKIERPHGADTDFEIVTIEEL